MNQSDSEAAYAQAAALIDGGVNKAIRECNRDDLLALSRRLSTEFERLNAIILNRYAAEREQVRSRTQEGT